MSDPDDTDREPVAVFEERLAVAASAVEDASTESDLDEAEAVLAEIEDDLEAATLAAEADDLEDNAPQAAFEDRISELRDDIADQRGPYVEDVIDVLDSAASTITESRWAEEGEDAVVAAVESCVEAATVSLPAAEGETGPTPAAAAETLGALQEALADSGLHPDTDADEIGELLDGAERLESALEEATRFTELEIREQLRRDGFYDVLEPENRKDFPPEWTAIKLYEKRGEVEPILLALEKLDSEFMQENALDALEHIAPVEAFEAVHALAQRRDPQAIRVLGRIGDERACPTLHGFLGGGGVALETTVLRALGMIGNRDSADEVVERLGADSPAVRSATARSLGLIGDTRAIDPLATVLSTDGSDEVRASAAWALNQIGTQRAREVVAEYTDDRSYIVQTEARNAAR